VELRIVNVPVVGFWEVIENDAFPSCAITVTGEDAPLILIPESPEVSVTVSASFTGAKLLLQSRSSTEIVEVLPTEVVLSET
jgi:hypothetical protein